MFRSDHNTRQQIEAVEDTPLLPGDTIEIALRNEYDVEATRFRAESSGGTLMRDWFGLPHM